MYCTKCGTENIDNAVLCVNCMETINPTPAVSTYKDPLDTAAMRMVLPVGRSVFAILAGYAGLFSLIILPAPFALILGILGIIDIKKNPEKHGMGRSIFGLVMGIIFSIPLVLYIGVLILSAFAK
ncbi:MAG: DUF4190 domain-containing protein [Phycisphaerae bacterium]|nr:DUF4190 domain-containing protein [Phycisphaerae bacterium]